MRVCGPCYPEWFESGWHPGVAVEQVAEGVEFADAPFGGGGQVGLDEREVGESFDGAPAASGAALLDLDGPDCPFGFVVGEDVQVGAGREAEDHVLEVQEPAGDPAGVLRSRGPALGVRGEPVRGERLVAGEEVLQDGSVQDCLPGLAGFSCGVASLDEQAGHLRGPVLFSRLEVVQVLQVPQEMGSAPGVQRAGEVPVAVVTVADDDAGVARENAAGVDRVAGPVPSVHVRQVRGAGAAPLDAGLEQACAERLGCPLVQGYGLTETTTAVSSTAGAPLGPRHGSVGVLLPGTQARIVNPASGQDLDAGEPGELWVRGPQVMRGYLNAKRRPPRPFSTRAAGYAPATCAAWTPTATCSWSPGQGADQIQRASVAPAELEAVLLAHPHVADAAVVRSPDQQEGEIPKAFVVANGPVDAQALMAWVAEQVAPYKRIRRVEFIDEIPKGPYGKVLRHILLERDHARPE